MADSTLQRLKELDKEREQLLAIAKKDALAKANAALADLNALGFHYSLVQETRPARRRLARGGGRKVKDAPCPVCKFKTAPPHDARKHRGQGKRKRPFNAGELQKLGLAKA